MTPFFLETARGNLFAVLHAANANAPAEKAILALPPFAEENNRSRHVLAACARALAADGFDVLLLDPLGTGDSDGVFEDASWTGWREDALAAVRWLEARGCRTVSIAGLRAGALLAADVYRDANSGSLIFWQPVTNGRVFLRQFLRLRVAAGLTQADAPGEDTKSLEARLANGETLEVAGYALTSQLASEISALTMKGLRPAPGSRVLWLEVGAAESDLSPAAGELAGQWRSDGVHVVSGVADGPPFWSLAEPEPCPDLVAATRRLIAEAGL